MLYSMQPMPVTERQACRKLGARNILYTKAAPWRSREPNDMRAIKMDTATARWFHTSMPRRHISAEAARHVVPRCPAILGAVSLRLVLRRIAVVHGCGCGSRCLNGQEL